MRGKALAMTVATIRLVSNAPASPASRASDLLALARSRDVADRERLLLGVAALCEAASPTPNDPVHATLGDIFMILAGQAERDVRRVLSENLANADWAPPALIAMLAMDEIEIARPIISASPLLQDADLLRVLVETTTAHQIEVARRPRISARVADAIIDRAEPAALTALAGNRTAEIDQTGIQRLVEASRRVAALRAPLIRHPRLNNHLAAQLYGWVGQSLRHAISERFHINTEQLDAAIAASVQAVYAPLQVGLNGTPDLQRDDMERRLIGKLESSGQLRPGYLIRAIREGRLSLFETALASLGGFSLGDIRNAVRASSPDALALACASVGIDRAVYPALLEEIRRLNAGLPGGALSPTLWQHIRSPEAAGREFNIRVRNALMPSQ
jgi:uncharacterized protein (DUF2336 family)